MKISALQNNYSPSASSPSRANTSFKGKYQINKELTKKIADNSNGFVKFITKLGKNNGEILNTLVTAVGTAFVAPIFIAFNPLSKEDKETKIYSAMRQPISAVIAVIIQIGVNTKFNHWVDKLASTGQLDRAKLITKPQNSYLKSILKLEQPNLSKEGIAKNIEAKQNKAFWKEVDSARNKMKNTKIEYRDLVDPATYKEGKSQVKKELEKELKGLSKKEVKRIVDDKGFERAIIIVEEQMKVEAKTKFRIARLANSGKSFDEVLATLTAQHKSILDRVEKSEGSAKTLSENAANELNELIIKLQNTGDFGKGKEVVKNFDAVLQGVKIKKLVKVGINNAEEVLKSSKKWGGIVLSLATLPVSCGILNWAYPRLMEKLMPEIANAKKTKEAK